MSQRTNIISVSGGKDSTALLLLALERETPNLRAVFADTGNENQMTYDYVQYLSDEVHPIEVYKADFSRQIAKKAEFVATKWREQGIPEEKVQRAISALKPTGNPFLDLCIWKGRFPSAKARFCSEELKRNPIIEQVYEPILEDGGEVYSWQGVRRDESINRAKLDELEEVGGGLWNYRPILDWTADDCFAMHKKHGVKHNPLYELGMGRVGCMPCVNCRKDELLQISKRFPEEIDRIESWEAQVKESAKQDNATFFHDIDGNGIRSKVEWSQTRRGGKEIDMFRRDEEPAMCSSIYGLCE
jgi:3'-phosphoadenosine 5'-phosphosulfate sulfotransferase (PAPS reductase)/FAD synthetase